MLCNVLETSVEGENGAGLMTYCSFIWVKVSKNGPSKICGRQPFQNLKWYGLPKQTIPLQIF